MHFGRIGFVDGLYRFQNLFEEFIAWNISYARGEHHEGSAGDLYTIVLRHGEDSRERI